MFLYHLLLVLSDLVECLLFHDISDLFTRIFMAFFLKSSVYRNVNFEWKNSLSNTVRTERSTVHWIESNLKNRLWIRKSFIITIAECYYQYPWLFAFLFFHLFSSKFLLILCANYYNTTEKPKHFPSVDIPFFFCCCGKSCRSKSSLHFTPTDASNFNLYQLLL